ncbi:helix-turn-helix domain-containing protein [Kibdelosporangium philippinense]|uniref:helix-turn-helix domain-containing protein n=1 Tax=Kibdelosporangium philippinense TaxID=211113 RepID=UPI00355706D0
MTSTPQRRSRGIIRPSPQPAPAEQEQPRHHQPDSDEPLVYTADQAAALLQVPASWLRRKAAARAIPCRYIGKHLRFTRTDLLTITDISAAKRNQR